ncbi:hypothetical protein TSACC_21683 [Terrimicrobium sacchariphilum]|uniref:Uncharacterized protein n=1 Tax=Terrimicrobium sacchariphilum TaxID=690879 RepID=A0A146G6S1_TERSA|nr:hypothetical protein TSACC_21683 [Terrimicrobium sacchariphilum]
MSLTLKQPLGSESLFQQDLFPLATLTSDLSATFGPKTCEDTLSATSSPGLADGAEPCNLQDGQKIVLYGPGAVHASHSAPLESNSGQQTRGISGPSSSDSSPSSDLQRALANRLRAALDVNGSPEYVLTWKEWPMKSGPPICALRASVRRTSASVFGGWLTPKGSDAQGGWQGKDLRTTPGGGLRKLIDQAMIAGWLTPSANEDAAGNWGTGMQAMLGSQVKLVSGTTQSGTNAETGKRGGLVLNPRFSLWLMGYPEEWASCGEAAMQSFRKRPRSSSNRQRKQSEDSNGVA